MKKKTNEILWTTIIAAIVIFLLYVTIDFQIYYHRNPKNIEKEEIQTESHADVEVEEYDDTTIVTTNEENGNTTTTIVRKPASK